MKSIFPLLLCALLGCGLMAGLFFAFSVNVMRALGQLPPDKGMAAMQAINVAILNPVFLLVFMGTATACAILAIYALLHWQTPGVRYLFAGSLCYLLGIIVVTMVFNVPMNDALAKASPTTPEGTRLWANYLTNWTAWNHVRTVTGLAATTLFALALFQPAPP